MKIRAARMHSARTTIGKARFQPRSVSWKSPCVFRFSARSEFGVRHIAARLSEAGGRDSELTVEAVREMAVAGEAQIERQAAEVLLPASERLDRRPQPQPGEVAMNRQSGGLAEHAAKVERARPQLPGESRQADRLAEGASQEPAEVLGQIAATARRASRCRPLRAKAGGDNFRGYFQGGLLNLERVDSISSFQAADQRTMPYESPGGTGTRGIQEGSLGR